MDFTNYKFVPTDAPATYGITLPDRLKRLEVNVKDFGAVGDGVHDDTSNIQQAFDAAFGPYINPLAAIDRTLIRSVRFPAGSYIVTSMLTIRGGEGSTIRGSGRDSTRLIYKGPIAAGPNTPYIQPRTILFRTNGWGRMLVENMSFEMTGAGLTVGVNGRGPEAFANHYQDNTVCFDWNWDDSAGGTNTSTCCWMNCKFSGATKGMALGQEYYDPQIGSSTTANTIGPVATSTTSNNITASTTKDFTTQTGKSAFFPVGAIIEISMNDPGDPGHAPPIDPTRLIMRGKVVSYNNGTGALRVDTASGPDGAAQGDDVTTVHPILAGPIWYIWQCRKTFTITPAGLENTFLVAGHITPMVSPGNQFNVNSFDRARVISYNNSTGVLVLNTSAFDGYGTYYDATGVQSNYTLATPPSVTASAWTFRHWWGYECDASSWFNCVFEDCYIGMEHGNQNVINCQFVGGAFRRCLWVGWLTTGGVLQCYIGISFEDNGIKQAVLGGTLGDDGNPDAYEGNYTDVNLNYGPPSLMLGCVSTSKHFLGPASAGLGVVGCRHVNSNPGIFLRSGVGLGDGNNLESCFSSNGLLAGWGGQVVMSVCDCSFSNDFSGSTYGPVEFHELVRGDPFTFAQLPPSGWLGQGLVVPISNGGANTFGTPVTSGTGSFHTLLHWNGTGWTIMGK